MDQTAFSQTMDIDVDFDGNQSYQPTRMLSTMFGNNHTFNFEDTEVTFEFTKYVQQLCNEMEEAKNRIDNGIDSEAIKSLLENLIDKVQQDMSVINNSMNLSLNGTIANQTVASNRTAINKNNVTSNSKNETSILNLLADLFREDRHEKDPIENISKLNVLSKSLKNLSANLSMNQTSNSTVIDDRSILKSVQEEVVENKENATNVTFQESNNLTPAEVTFINNSVCSPLMELISAVEKKIDIERIEEDLKANYEEQLKAKDDLINQKISLIDEKDDQIDKLKQDLLNLENKFKKQCMQTNNTLEQLERAKKENEVLDEIISDEKRKLNEKQFTIEQLHVKISESMNQVSAIEEKNIELKKELNRLKVMEKENESLNEQVANLLNKVNKMFELEKKITLLTVDCNEKQSQINNISFELKTNIELNGRLAKEKTELMNRLDCLAKEDSDKAVIINELKAQTVNLTAQLSLQNDKCDFISAKLKDTTALKSQLERDRKDVCWQINDLLKNPDVDFDDLKTFLIRVEEKINNIDFKKPKGCAFIKSLAGQTATAGNETAG